MEGARRRFARERDDRLYVAWHVAAWSRAAKMPKLKDVLGRQDNPPPRRAQTVDEQIAIARSWHAALTARG